MLRAFRSLNSFDDCNPRGWLLTILRNANINRTRRQRPSLLRGDDHGGEADRRNRPSLSAEDAAAGSMPSRWITEALTHRTTRLRQVVQLVDVEGITYDEAAAVLGIPSGTFMSRLHRARHQMRARPARHSEFRSRP